MNPKLTPLVKKLDAFKFRVDHSILLSDIFTLTACRISMCCDIRSYSQRKEESDRVIKNYLPEEQQKILDITNDIILLCAEMAEPDGEIYDYLGELYMASNTSSKQAGQFFTPYNVSKLTAKLALTNKDISNEIVTFDEPTCGSGGMILGAIDEIRNCGINYAERVFVHCADLDSRCVRMCYIQLSCAGVPAIIHKRNTLTMQTFETWYTPAFTFNYLRFRKYEVK